MGNSGSKPISVDIIDLKRFGNYSNEDRDIFVDMRDSMLEIFPNTSFAVGKYEYDKMSIELAEKFAFRATDRLIKLRDSLLEEIKKIAVTAATTSNTTSATSIK